MDKFFDSVQFVNLYLQIVICFIQNLLLKYFLYDICWSHFLFFVSILIFVSVAPPPAPCEPVRGWSKKTTAKAADEDSRAGEGGDGEVAFDDSEGDDDDDDDDSDGDEYNPSLITHRQCWS